MRKDFRKGFISTLLLGIGAMVLTAGVLFVSVKSGIEERFNKINEEVSELNKKPSVFSPKTEDGVFGTASGSGLYPTSTNNFQDGDIINAGDWNAIEDYLGTRNSSTSTTISYKANNPNIASSTGSLSSLSGTTGQIPINKGGTATSTAPSDGQLLIGSGGLYKIANLTAGTNIGIANSSGTITISNTFTNQLPITTSSMIAGVSVNSASTTTGFLTGIPTLGISDFATLFTAENSDAFSGSNFEEMSINGTRICYDGTNTQSHLSFEARVYPLNSTSSQMIVCNAYRNGSAMVNPIITYTSFNTSQTMTASTTVSVNAGTTTNFRTKMIFNIYKAQ